MPQPRDANPKPPGKSPSPESPSPGAEGASSTASAKASQGTEPGFLGDAGPAFEPGHEAAPQPPEPELKALPFLEPEWEEKALSELLTAQGELLHTFAGVADDDWRYTQADLMAIAPPLSRILNRYPVTRAAASAQDPLALAVGVSAYAIRSGRERQLALRALAEEPEEPITGVPAHESAAPINAEVDAESLDWSTD